MAIVLGLPTEVEARLRDYAAHEGYKLNDLLRLAAEDIASKSLAKIWKASDLLKLPVVERRPILREMAPFYEADLALPHEERELAALIA